MTKIKNIKKEFGLQIFKLRQEKSKRLATVAKEVKINKDLLEKTELGKGVLDIRMIKILAKYYNQDISIILKSKEI
ncbi:MAG: hypothetical protein R3Y43_03815 [Alphaproteobacteria bacterium]